MPSDRLTPAGERVLAAANSLFYRDGINTVGVAQIADTAAVTKKTLYDCFGSKDNLVVAYLRHRHATWWAYLERLLTERPAPHTLVLVEAYFEHPLEHGRGCAFLNAVAELPPGHPGLAVIREHKALVREQLADLVSREAPSDAPDDLAEQVFLIIEGAISHVGLDDPDAAAEAARRVIAALLR